MKWKDLSLKERKQIYDSVRVNNPGATYFDIKEQFDSIPEYEDGKAGYTPEERAWVARRTVELGMEGKPAPQDSLYTIVDRAKVQNKPKKYDPTDSAIEQGKQVLSGLNKTVALVNKAHSADATNNYMEYLLDRDNIMSYNEIRQSLMDVNPNTYRYLTTPSENKAHMIQLKRGMQKEGLINNWTDPITQDKIEEYLSYRSKYANRVNPVLRTLYDIRPDKQGFINRMNNLTPIEWAVPLGLPMFFGEEQENK